MRIENDKQGFNLALCGVPCVIDDNGNSCTAVVTHDSGGGIRLGTGKHALQSVVHPIPVEVRAIGLPPHWRF